MLKSPDIVWECCATHETCYGTGSLSSTLTGKFRNQRGCDLTGREACRSVR